MRLGSSVQVCRLYLNACHMLSPELGMQNKHDIVPTFKELTGNEQGRGSGM